MARDKERIELILDRLEDVWKANPDLRLGQLLLNVVNDPVLYYIEDKNLIEKLEEFYLGEIYG